MNGLNQKHLLWILPLALLLVGVMVFAFRFGVADVRSYPARYEVERWFKESRLPTGEELDKSMAAVESALEWNPANAEYFDLKAYLLWQKILMEQASPSPGGDAKIRAYASEAIELHRQAIEIRPRWPYSWSGIVLMKAYLQQHDQDFDQALLAATRFGPWENTVNIQVALAGQFSWPHLSEASQALVIDNFDRGIRRNAKVIARNLKFSPYRSAICQNMSREIKQYKRVCG